jgi:DNA repair ATPase RecN
MNKIFKISVTKPGTPTSKTPTKPGTPTSTTPTATPPVSAPVATTNDTTNDTPSSNIYGETITQKQQEITKLVQKYAKEFVDPLSSLQNEKSKLEALNVQNESLFTTSQANCVVYNFIPKIFKNNPCDFITESFGNDIITKNVSLQEVQKNYKNYIDTLNQLIKNYDDINSLMDKIKAALDTATTNQPKINQSANSLIESVKAQYNTDKINLVNNKTQITLKNDPLLDMSMGKSILDCYEEIIEINENLCEKVYQPLQKSFATLGMGPVLVYAQQLLTGYQDIMRIYTQELSPIYSNLAQKSQTIDQKRIQYTLNMLSKIIPQSYRIQILAIEKGIFQIRTQNNPSELKKVMGLL